MTEVQIRQAVAERDLAQVRELTAEYVAWDSRLTAEHGLDAQEFLDFYYGSEPEQLPGPFAPPDGFLLLATAGGRAAGCAGFIRMDEQSCALKRVYVRDAFRGAGVGRRMVSALIGVARSAGYRAMLLETTTFMGEAQRLYRALGFVERPPYYAIPPGLLDSTRFMELRLAE